MDDNTKTILNKYGAKNPVPVIALAKELGADVFTSASLADSVSGFISKSASGGYDIVVNAAHSMRRKRFTIAHEVAHLILHKDKIDAMELPHDFVKRPAGALAREKGEKAEAEEKMEKEADQLAAEILMPEGVFRSVWKNSKDVEEVADYFKVSQAAATVRASVLTCETTF